MTWFKVDDGFYDHPKVAELLSKRSGKGAIATWTRCGSWCSKQERDGFVPESVAKQLGATPVEISELVRVGLWTRVKDGYVFHDWHDCNPSSDELQVRRNKTKDRVSAWRGKQSGNGVTTALHHVVTNDSVTPPPTRPVPTRPDPSRPDQREESMSALGSATAIATRKAKASKAETGDTWQAYADAYRARYGEAPVRNAKVSGQLAQLLKRISADEAPHVARHYVSSSNARYVASGHSTGMLLADAEKLRTEWATGRTGTAFAARQADKRVGRGAEYQELLDRLHAEDVAAGRVAQ